MNILEDIIPLSGFRQQASDTIKKIQIKKRPIFITINGKVEAVIQDAKSYQSMLDKIKELEASSNQNYSLQATTDDFEKPMEDVLKDIKKELESI